MNRHGEKAIGAYWAATPQCEEWDAAVLVIAERVSEMIRRELPGVSIEHIGSTAVPGCAGKGIIDLMLLYPDGKLEAAKTVLENLGFQHQVTPDRFPEVRPMRTGSIEQEGRTYRLHVHVIAASSPEADELRRFRDRLREDNGLRERYVVEKRRILALGVFDSIDYAEKKGKFVQEFLRLEPKEG